MGGALVLKAVYHHSHGGAARSERAHNQPLRDAASGRHASIADGMTYKGDWQWHHANTITTREGQQGAMAARCPSGNGAVARTDR